MGSAAFTPYSVSHLMLQICFPVKGNTEQYDLPLPSQISVLSPRVTGSGVVYPASLSSPDFQISLPVSLCTAMPASPTLRMRRFSYCLLYTSDAADERS